MRDDDDAVKSVVRTQHERGVPFRLRLAYARWLHHLRTGACAGNAEIGREVGVTGPWVTKWAKRDDAPDSRQTGRRLCQFLGVSELWLLDDEENPPEPDLWKQWLDARNAAYQKARVEDIMARYPSTVPMEPANEYLARKRKPDGKKRRA